MAVAVLCRSARYGRGRRTEVRGALLFDLAQARPARAAGRRPAAAGRRGCPTCGAQVGYRIPRHLGECLGCASTRATPSSAPPLVDPLPTTAVDATAAGPVGSTDLPFLPPVPLVEVA